MSARTMSMHQHLTQTIRCHARGALFALLIFVHLFPFSAPVSAAPSLNLKPITWNVVGLDSNNVNVGPNNFPVGVRVCNSGTAATNIVATFVWDSIDSPNRINLRSGSQNPITWSSLANSECHDFYFEVSVERNSDAYNHTRRYHITITTNEGVSASTTTPREVFVERLISQNRNATNDVKLDGVSIPAGGAMSLIIGNTYNITLNASTATNGYEQIESFINFPNTIFRVNSVVTTYSANAGTDSDAATKLYANGCTWENDPNSPNYRSCLSTGKYGGTVTVVYNVAIIGGAGTSQTLSTLIYDFSGSSYHYNADFSTATRIANIIGPSSVTIAKRFVPDAITPGNVSQLMFTLSNPTNVSIGGVKFTDNLPSGVVVAGIPSISYTGCGGGAFSPTPTSGNTSVSFQNGVIAPNSSCIIRINVTAASVGTYNNTTGNLYINDTTNTGNTASATLTVANAPACTPGITMANWTIPTTSTNPPDTGTGVPTIKASNVTTATASANLSGSTVIDTASGVGDTSSWKSWGYKNAGQYVQFVIDTRHFTGVSMSFATARTNGGADPTSATLSYNSGAGFTNALVITPTTSFITSTVDFTGLTSASSSTTFRLTASGANNDNSGAAIYYDNIKFTGCSNLAPPPTISKTFSPSTIPVNSISTLTFTISNTQTANEPLTNVSFSDPLPAGLEVANPPSASTSGAGCTGVTFNPAVGATTINYTASNMAAGATCTAQVNIKATKAGQFDNVSGFISATESGQNKTSTGYATASLVAIAPPSISKSFAASPIFASNTTTLNFTISNPNQSTTLTGVQFSDPLPAGVTATNSSSSQCGGTLTISSNTISLAGGSIAANGSCTFSVTVTGATSGVKTNTTGAVSSTNGGTGNTASATLEVRTQTPNVSLLKQVGSTATGPWTTFITVTTVPQNVYFNFTVENTGDTALTNVSINDPGVNLSNCTTTLSGGLALYQVKTCVSGAVNISATGWFTNTAYATGDTATSLNSIASYATTELTFSKGVTEGSYSSAGNLLHYTYAITNTGFAPLMGPVTVTDDKTTAACPAVSTVGDLDNYFDPAESITCTASYTIQAGDVGEGKSVTNIASSTVGGVASNEDSKTVPYLQPTAVRVSSFNAQAAQGKNLQVTWTTASEINVAGFNLYRAENPAGPFLRINQYLLPASKDALSGSTYQYLDMDVAPGKIYYYRLEEITLNGTTTQLAHSRIAAPAHADTETPIAGTLLFSIATMTGSALCLVIARSASLRRSHTIRKNRLR